MKGLHMITFILLVIGGLNWGLYIFGYDVARLLSLPEMIANTIYALVAISAIVEAIKHKSMCSCCKDGKCAPNTSSQTM